MKLVPTLDDYESDFEAGWFEAQVAEANQQIIGVVLYYNTYSTWKGKMVYLEDFVVQKAYRKKGVGQLLFDAFLTAARQKGARLVKWQVLDWNEPALQFYYKNKATVEQNWWTCKLFLEPSI